MRIISTLSLLLFSSVCFSQIDDLIRKSKYGNTRVKTLTFNCSFGGSSESSLVDLPSLRGKMVRPKGSVLLKGLQIKVPDVYVAATNNKDTAKKPETKIVLRCGNRFLNETPLFVVDGVPQDDTMLKTLDPIDIECIDILKDAAASAIYGCRALTGVVLITTKQSKLRKFVIRDFLDGIRIPGATVSFISADKKDTIIMAANDSGVVVTDKLKSSNKYSITVSSVGYKTQTKIYQSNYIVKENEILLEKNVNTCGAVVVSVIGLYRRIRCYCGGISIIGQKSDVAEDKKASVIKIFPNPAPKGKTITIETTTQSDGPIEIRLISLDGKLLLSQPQKVLKGLNRFTINTDTRWTAGIYFLQLYANGKLLASDKVIIQ